MLKIYFIIGASLLLAGCGNSVSKPTDELNQSIQLAQMIQKTVEAKIESQQLSEKVYQLKIILSNPEQKPIVSAQTWLAYNPQDLKILEIDSANSNFELFAPGENEFDQTLWLIKIGRSKQAAQINQSEILVTQLTVEKQTENLTTLDFYNYHEDVTGNTNVNLSQNDQVYNVLIKPNTPALSF